MMINQLPATGSVVGTDEFALDKSGTTYKGKISDIIALAPQPTSATPQMDGTAAVGTSSDYARADHVHPKDTSIPSPSSSNPIMDGTADPGSSSDYARADHVHPKDTSIPAASSATPQALGTATAGTSDEFSRADHVHPKLTLYNKLISGTTDGTGNLALGADFNTRLIVNVQTTNALVVWGLGVAAANDVKMLHFWNYQGVTLASTAVTVRVYWLDPSEFASSEVT